MRNRKLSMGLLVGALFCGLCLAQQARQDPSSEASQPGQQTPAPPAESNAQASAATPRIAPGSVIPVELTKTVDAKKVKTGDEVEALVTEDLKSGNGQLVVAKDTKVVGHITEAQARSKDQHESQIGIAFDHAVLKDGRDVALPMSIQAIIAPQSMNPGPGADTDAPQPSPASQPGGVPPNGGGRPGAMGTGAPPAPAPNPPMAGDEPAASSGTHQAITANTQGVIGISDMKLSTAGEETQGSVVSSEKKNVKLDNGTLMLLKVNQ
jgi:hypothetical protein